MFCNEGNHIHCRFRRLLYEYSYNNIIIIISISIYEVQTRNIKPNKMTVEQLSIIFHHEVSIMHSAHAKSDRKQGMSAT